MLFRSMGSTVDTVLWTVVGVLALLIAALVWVPAAVLVRIGRRLPGWAATVAGMVWLWLIAPVLDDAVAEDEDEHASETKSDRC